MAQGYTLKLDRETMPRLLYRVMREGLIMSVDLRDLELGEARDMLRMYGEGTSRAEDRGSCWK